MNNIPEPSPDLEGRVAMNTTELELKFRLSDDALHRCRSELQSQGAREEHLRARYFDTVDRRLAAAKISLRLRQEGDRWVQTLKTQGDDAVRRLEHEVTVPVRDDQPPRLDIGRHEKSHAGKALAEALGGLPPDALVEQFETDVVRLKRQVEVAPGSLIEVALDVGVVRAGDQTADIAEFEIEHKEGSPAGVFDVALNALQNGGLWLSTVSKAEQGDRLRGYAAAHVTKAAPLSLPSHADSDQLLRAVLANVMNHVLPNLSAVAEGSDNPEEIHQARVGLRRLRTAVRELGRMYPEVRPGWERPLGKAFSKLGERRDNETVADAVQPLLEAAGAPKTRWTPPPFPDTAEAVRQPELQAVLVQLLALTLAHDKADDSTLRHKALKNKIAQRLSKLHRQVVSDGRHFEKLATDHQHRVRKRLKRLRYLTEFVRPLWSERAVDRYVDRLKPAQEALGTHNDTAVAAEKFREDAHSDPSALFAAGYLQAHLDQTQRAAWQALRKIGDRKPFWDKD